MQAGDGAIFDQTGVVDTGLAQRLPQVIAGGVPSDQRDEADLGAERGEVGGRVRRASGAVRGAGLAYDGYRGLFAEPDGVAFEPGVEHRVTDDEDA